MQRLPRSASVAPGVHLCVLQRHLCLVYQPRALDVRQLWAPDVGDSGDNLPGYAHTVGDLVSGGVVGCQPEERRQRQEQPPWEPDEDALVLAANADAIHLPGPRLLPGMEATPSEHSKRLCAKVDGFSLHAARTVEATDREGLERLCRYGLRSPLSLERLSIDSDGQVRYQLRKPWFDGRTEILMEPIPFLRRLAALVPAPYTNLVRYYVEHRVMLSSDRKGPSLGGGWPVCSP